MRSPSGDHIGPRWRPESAASVRTVPVATSATEMSACRDELTWWVGVWSKAISAAVRRPIEGPDGEPVSPGQAAGFGSRSYLGHPKMGHAEVRVFDGVVAVAFLALLEVVGGGVGGRERDPAAVG